MTHTGTLWQYLGSFVMYTLMTVGLIYGVFWYTRKASGIATATEEAKGSLVLESTLALEPNKTLYVVRSGSERFLLSASGEGTQLLSALASVPGPILAEPVSEPVAQVELPWYASVPSTSRPVAIRRQSFGQRFVQSVRWLVTSRTR